MLNWFLSTGHKLAGIVIFLTQLLVHWEDIVDRFVGWFKIGHLIERRRDMIDPLKYLKLVPVLEKLVSDLQAAAQSPQDQAVVEDIKQLIADLKS